jgi:hypothetical protein
VADYEECYLLEHANPVHIPQKTYYISATEPSQLKLCKIVFTAVTMKNADFWDIKTQFLPHRKHIISPL